VYEEKEEQAMAKQKTKEVPFGRTAAEVQPGFWQWDLGGRTWYYRQGLGVNCGFLVAEELKPLISAKDLNAAGHFAEGFSAGEKYQRRVAANA